MDVPGRLAELIAREGPVPFSRFVDVALYDADAGFFVRGGGAGRAGADFVTSPEVGPLFGALVARELDAQWEALGRPDPFVVVEAGAGRGRLARDVLRAGPACAPALRYLLVERSAALRDAQRALLTIEPVEDALGPALPSPDGEGMEPVPASGPIVAALEDLPAITFDGVVLANELLDNVPFDVVVRTVRGWDEVRVGIDPDGCTEVLVPAAPELVAELAELDPANVPVGTRLPVQRGAAAWLVRAASLLRRGSVVLVDYMAELDELVGRDGGWLRTYRAHERGADPLATPGHQDVTADVALGPLRRAAARAGLTVRWEGTQREWLLGLGLESLVDDARARWDERAHVGDLEALTARSRVTEGAALVDPAGLGAHRVLVCGR